MKSVVVLSRRVMFPKDIGLRRAEQNRTRSR